MRSPPCPQDDDRDDVDKHRDDDERNDNDDHRGAVETNAGESNGYYCHLALFNNTPFRYVVEAIV